MMGDDPKLTGTLKVVGGDEGMLNARLAQMQTEGQGAWQISFWNAAQLPALMLAGAAGETDAIMAVNLFSATAEEIARMDKALMCLTCDNTFAPAPGRMPGALVLLEALNSASGQALAQGMCRECCGLHRNIAAQKAAVIAALAEHIGLTGAREIDIRSPGHA